MLSGETPTRRRWLVLAAIVAVGLTAFLHTWVVDLHLTFVSSVERTDHPIHTPLQRIRPGFTADVDMWIRYALELLEGNEAPRSHHTAVDNPPQGRAVHWNSGLIWWIAGLGSCWQKISGLPLPAAVERAAVWANLPLLLLFVAGFAWWAGRRAGALAGVVVAVAMLGHRSIYEGFMPAYPDHHGLIAAGILGLMLGTLFMGGGWMRGSTAVASGLALLPADEKSACRAAAWSGFWGGFGMWISTASLAIPLATVPLGALLALLACRQSLHAAGARFSPAVWRTWGRTGALTSLAFYLLEYFPSQLGWRLEVNHPLYALAWWAGAELTASVLGFLATPPDQRPVLSLRALLLRVAWLLPLVLAPALVILWRGPAVFVLVDPFMVRLHRTIIEFMPLLARLRSDGVANHFEYLFLFPLLYVAAALLLVFGPRPARHAIWLMFTPVVLLVALGFVQSRWALSAGSAEIPLLLACFGAAFERPFFGATPARRWLTAVLAASVLYLPGTIVLLHSQLRNLREHIVPVDEVLELTYREIAQAIRDSQPRGPVVLFASPNASLGIGYYGRFRTLGTLYWENGDGLKAAAELNSAPNDDAAAQIIRRLGVTHIALVPTENYVLEYASLLHPGLNPAALQATFGYRLLGKKQIPVWLEPVLYRSPRNLPGKLAGLEVFVFKVNFHQTPAEAFYRLGQLLALQEKTDASLDDFAWAAQLAGDAASPWLRRGELYLRKKQWPEAVENLLHGIDLAPPGDRYKLFTQAGVAFEGAGGIEIAVEFYRRAIVEPMTNAIALNNLAWLLATTTDDKLRDPVQALQLARDAVAREPSEHGNLDTLGAAFAANQHFVEAIAAADQARALAEKAGDRDSVATYQRHLQAYRAGRPWRE